MLQTYLTGLREGLEAALVISILLTFLIRAERRDRLGALWAGVAIAVVASLGFGALLYYTSASMTFEAQETFAGVLSIIAVGFVTWMVFWMRRASHTLKGDLQDKMAVAVEMGAIGVALAALVAVGREGLETALFLYPTFQAQGAGAGPAIGAILGIATAVALGALLYRGSLKLNLSVFFRVTGALLIVIAAGVLAYGIHDLQEAGVVGGLNTLAWDIKGYELTSWYGALMKGIFNLGPQMTVLEVTVYFAYLIPTMYLFLRPMTTKTTKAAASSPSTNMTAASPTATYT